MRDGRQKPFSNYEDLFEAAHNAADEGFEPEEFYSEAFFSWITQGQVGCHFARVLARDPHKARWESLVIHKQTDFVKKINNCIRQKVEDGYQALQIILPGYDTPESIAELVTCLCADNYWYWEEISWDTKSHETFPENCLACNGRHSEHPRSVLIGLRYILNTDYTVWVLGFSPFEGMPITRRLIGAPFAALQLRIQPPPDPFEPLPSSVSAEFQAHRQKMQGQVVDRSKGGVHLCDMDEIFIDQPWGKFFKQSERLKSDVLNNEPLCHARAKVTFVLPEALRSKLPPPGLPNE